MYLWESRLTAKIIGEELRAAALVLYCRRFEPSPDFAAISAETGISLDELRKAWEIVRTEVVNQPNAVEAL